MYDVGMYGMSRTMCGMMSYDMETMCYDVLHVVDV